VVDAIAAELVRLLGKRAPQSGLDSVPSEKERDRGAPPPIADDDGLPDHRCGLRLALAHVDSFALRPILGSVPSIMRRRFVRWRTKTRRVRAAQPRTTSMP